MKGKQSFVIIAAVVAIIAVIGAAFLLLNRGDDADATASTPEIVASKRATPLVPNSNSLGDTESIEMFGRLTMPQAQTWDQTMGEEGAVQNFADMTTCTTSVADCPHILLINLKSPASATYFKEDPLKWWTGKACGEGRSAGVVEGVQIELVHEAAFYYRQQCSADTADAVYAWHLPGKQLFVATTGPGVAPEIIQAALERAS